MSEMIGRLRVALGLETAAFEKGAKRAAAEIGTLGDRAEAAGFKVGSMAKTLKVAAGAFIGSAVADQLRQLVTSGLDYASALGETASQLGVTTATLQQYRYIATQVGLEQDEMDQALARLTRTLGDAAAGGKTQAAIFKMLQIEIRDANGQVKEAGDVIPLIATALGRIPDPAQRAAVLVDIFGKSGQKLAPLMEEGASGVDGLRNAAERLGIVLSDEQIQRADETADKLSELSTVLNAKIAGTVANNTTAIMQLANGLAWLAEKAGAAVNAWSQIPYMFSGKKFQDFVKDTYGGVELTFTPEELEWRKAQAARGKQGSGLTQVNRKGVWGTAATASGLQRTGSAYTGLGNSGYSAAMFGTRKTFVTPVLPITPPAKEIKLDFSGAKGGSKKSSAGGSSARAASREAEQLAEAMRKLSVWGVDASKAIGAANDNLVAFSDRAGPAMDKVLPAFEAGKLKAGEFADKLADLQTRLFPEIDALAKYRGELGLITRALDENKISAEQAAEWRHRLAMEGRSTETAIGELMAAGAPIVDVDKLNEGFDILQDRMKGLRDRSGMLTVEVAKSFKDMADDTISALENMTSAIQGGGFLNIFSAVLNMGLQLGSIGAFGSKIQTNINSVQKRAWGGQVNAGQMYMVGERGPEMFVAGAHGSIVPNHRLGGAGGSGGNVYYLSGNLLTPEFWGQINAGHAMAAQAGGEIGFRKVVTRGRRRVA